MPDLKYRQEKIQVKRKQTPWREFVMEICSRRPIMMYKNHGIISRYPTARIKNITNELSYETVEGGYLGNFFDSFQQLLHTQTLLAKTSFYANENAEYSDGSWGGKNFYLCFDAGGGSEDIAYSHLVFDNCHRVIQGNLIGNSRNVFDSSAIYDSKDIFFSTSIRNSSSIWFSSHLIGCEFCINCDHLQNKKYCVGNVQFSKTEYEKILSESLQNLLEKKRLPKNEDSTFGCEGVEHAYYSHRISHGRNLIFAIGGDTGGKSIYDGINCGLDSEDMYAISATGDRSSHLYCVAEAGNSSNCYYCYHIESCSFCLGCIGLKNKSFCIFNKQYTKEERHQKVDEIFSQMEKEGTLGQFFPGSMNPFYFNDTAAYLIDSSFTKQEVEAEGYLRRDEAIKVDIPEGVEVVKTSELGEYEGRVDILSTNDSDSGSPHPAGTSLIKGGERGDYSLAEKKRTIDPSILKKVIQDEEGNVYRIVKMEYDFLVKHSLPLPRLHWLERLKQNFRIR